MGFVGYSSVYKKTNYKQDALNIVDQFIGFHTAKAEYIGFHTTKADEEINIKAVEVLKDLRANIELHWGK